MQFGRAITWISITSVLFAAIGAAVGYLIGSKMPGYYRSVFDGGDLPHFDPLAVGFGQGLTQGLVLGATVGLVLVLASWWKESRLAGLAIEERNRQQSPLTPESARTDVDEELRLRF